MRLVIVIVTQPTPRLIISARQLIQRCGTKFRMHCQEPYDFQSVCITNQTDTPAPGITVTIRLDQVPPQLYLLLQRRAHGIKNVFAKQQIKLWWDLVQADGYGYAWGRSVGLISYADTLEIIGFLAVHPEFRPATLDQLASAYYQAWRWLRRDYSDKTHGFSMFAFGRGNYSYITREREWQQTISIVGKISLAQQRFKEGLDREKISLFSSDIARPDLARFQFFRH